MNITYKNVDFPKDIFGCSRAHSIDRRVINIPVTVERRSGKNRREYDDAIKLHK